MEEDILRLIGAFSTVLKQKGKRKLCSNISLTGEKLIMAEGMRSWKQAAEMSVLCGENGLNFRMRVRRCVICWGAEIEQLLLHMETTQPRM